MKKRLLILGSLREFVQLIETAKSRGIYTIVVDGYKGSIGKRHADKAYDIPPGNIEEIAELCRREEVDSIITSFSDYLFECIVKIADRAGLKCYFTPDRLDFYRNKQTMKDMLQKLGIETPKSAVLFPDFSDGELEKLSFPVVTKPIDRYGSRGVFVLNSPEEVRNCFAEVCETSDIKKILVEEYHTGYEFNMMTWILDGKVHVLSIADREKTPVGDHQIPVNSRNVYPSRLIDHVYQEAADILQKVADFTGQKAGILSMQFFWKPGGPVSVCEVAGRFLGYEHELIEYCSGLAVESLMLDYLYDEDSLRRRLSNHSPFFQTCSATLYFHGRNGMTVEDQSAGERLSALPQVREYLPFYQKGETIIPHGPNPYVTRIYVSGETRAEVDAVTEGIFREMSVLDPDGREIVYRNEMCRYHGMV